MNERVLSWLQANEGEVFVSPRNNISVRSIKNFKIISVDYDKVKIEFIGSKYPALPLYFWMFDKTLGYLHKNRSKKVWLGTKWEPPYEIDSIEGQIWRLPYPKGNTSYKAAPHVCDILALAGLIEYAQIVSPQTRRKRQAVKLVDNKKNSERSIDIR